MCNEIDEYVTKYWYLNTEQIIFHREDGPAIEDEHGNKYWYINGELHREDGPAIESANRKKYYYFNNELYSDIKTDEEWVSFLKFKNFL